MRLSTRRLRLLALGLALVTASCGRRAQNRPATFSTDGLHFFAAARLTGGADSLLVSVTARNDAGAERALQSGVCGDALVLRVYREPAVRRRHPAPVWDSAIWRRATDPPNRVCLPVAVLQVLAPGDSTAVAGLALPVRVVLGDSLPAARYRLTAQLHGEWEAGTVELRAPPT